MAQAKYDYDEVLKKYKELSIKNGKPLNMKQINESEELPSKNWFQRNGGINAIRMKLGLETYGATVNEFCSDCAKAISNCGYDPDNCPLKKEANLYYDEIEI